MTDAVAVFDTTLRDGLRNSGLHLELAERVRFAHALEELGVDVIEIGFGGPGEIDTMRAIAEAVGEPVVVGLTRVNRKDLDRVLRGVERARHPGVNVFSPASDRFLEKAGISRDRGLERSVAAIAHARRHVDHVQFSAQDASRANRDHLVALLAAVLQAGATVLSIADTVSHAEPDEFAALCRELRARVGAGESVTWSVHCHDERGRAAANSAAAVEAGVRQVECTVNGVGEGAGNTALEAFLEAVGAGGPLATRIRRERLAETGALLRALAGPLAR